MSSFVTFLVVAGIFGSFFGKGFLRTIGNILAAIASVIVVGGFILAQLFASGIIQAILGCIGLIIILIIFITWRVARRHPRQQHHHCQYECYHCPQRYRCRRSHY